jgi:SAM-dependent methyltransferase
MRMIDLLAVPTPESFDEAGYLRANPDVQAAVQAGRCRSGLAHFQRHGLKENRKQFCRQPRLAEALTALRQEKLARLASAWEPECPWQPLPDGRRDFRPAAPPVPATPVISSYNDYDAEAEALIAHCRQGLVLDCGAGLRPRVYDHVVTLDIDDHPGIDVLASAERLPFRDGTFDGVLSLAVLEHVPDPFHCARELIRVLRPGGMLVCRVPFLQPYHGYPHHYFNMTHQGAISLFTPALTIVRQEMAPHQHPVHSLRWIVAKWASHLSGWNRWRFLNLKLKDLLRSPEELLAHPGIATLPEDACRELAHATTLVAVKPLPPATSAERLS